MVEVWVMVQVMVQVYVAQVAHLQLRALEVDEVLWGQISLGLQ